MDAAEKRTEDFQLSREELLKLWDRVKREELTGLSAMERFYAGIIRKHRTLFEKEVDGLDHPETHEFLPEEGINPYLHVLLHGLVETQVLTRTPIEATQFANAMKKRGLDDHAIEHKLCAVFFPLILEGRNRGEETDMGKYAALLKKLKAKKPDKFDAALTRAFHGPAA